MQLVEATRGERQAFARKIRELVKQADDANESAVREMLAQIRDVQSAILRRMGRVREDSFTAQHLVGLRHEVTRSTKELLAHYEDRLPGITERAWAAGIDLADVPMAAAGFSHTGSLSTGALEAMTRYTADLIGGLSSDMATAINGVIHQATLGVITPFEAIQQVAGELPGRSVFPSLEARGEAIIRTEVGRVFSVAQQARLTQFSQTVGGLEKQWMSAGDSAVRETHAEADGQTVGAQDYYDVGGNAALYPRDPSLPPEESINCFPGDTRIEWEGLQAVWRRWYTGEFLWITTAGGRKLSGTPNHPVLTRHGWVGLGSLQHGDRLLCRTSVDPFAADPLPDVERGPARIGEVFDAVADALDAERWPLASVDFHGDALGEAYVEVVRTDRGLEANRIAQIFEEAPDLAFALAGVGGDPALRGLADLSPVESLGIWDTSPPDGIMGSSSQARPFFGAGVSHAREHRGRPAAGLDSGAQESASYDLAVDSEGTSDGQFRGAGKVTTDEIVDIQFGEFSGHVFNLSTDAQVYTAEGIIVHNCRCASVPVVPERSPA